MSNYATRSNSKNATGVDTSKFAKKDDLEVDELDIDESAELNADELQLVPVHLEKLSDVVDNDVVKKAACDELVNKVDTINTSKLVNKRL